jgi:hypothetical protein
MSGKGRQRRCRICHKRPPWKYKNCPPDIYKRCYHAHIWPERPAARQRGAVRADAAGIDTDDIGELGPMERSHRR